MSDPLLFAAAIAKCALVTGLGPGIAVAFAVEKINLKVSERAALPGKGLVTEFPTDLGNSATSPLRKVRRTA